MKVIDLLNKIANREDVPEKIRYDEKIWKLNPLNETYDNGECCLFEDYIDKNYVITDVLNDEIEIIEEDKLKTKIIVVDKEGNEKEYLLELGEGLKEGEKIFKADNGNWYAQKLIDKKSEFYKWLNEFKPTIYYSIEEDKKIEKIELEPLKTDEDLSMQIELVHYENLIIANKINEIIDYINKEEK